MTLDWRQVETDNDGEILVEELGTGRIAGRDVAAIVGQRDDGTFYLRVGVEGEHVGGIFMLTSEEQAKAESVALLTKILAWSA